jgi:hypothetical protein
MLLNMVQMRNGLESNVLDLKKLFHLWMQPVFELFLCGHGNNFGRGTIKKTVLVLVVGMVCGKLTRI